jgi:protoporphyrinogen oxidase
MQTSCRVESVRNGGSGAYVLHDGIEERFDRVVVTLASPLVPRIVPQLSSHERRLCEGVKYQGIVCASLLCDAPLTPYYITNITDPWVPFTAVIEMTALVDRASFNGRSLVYLPRYLPTGDPGFAYSDAEYEASFLGALERMHPQFSRSSVRAFRISRVPYVMPVPTLLYSQRVPPIQTSVPGVYLANSAHIVNGTLNVNETVLLANRVAKMLLSQHDPSIPQGVPA